jgi:hypothetical protein
MMDAFSGLGIVRSEFIIYSPQNPTMDRPTINFLPKH